MYYKWYYSTYNRSEARLLCFSFDLPTTARFGGDFVHMAPTKWVVSPFYPYLFGDLTENTIGPTPTRGRFTTESFYDII